MNKCKILIVDDDPDLSRLMAVILDRMGNCEVREENRSLSALGTAKAFRPHLVVLDVKMPDKDGNAVCAEFSRDPDLANTPIIFVTGLISKSESGFRGGFRYLPKPVDPWVLLDTVANLCSKFEPSAS
jgi:CheY-like chemotaxis protein